MVDQDSILCLNGIYCLSPPERLQKPRVSCLGHNDAFEPVCCNFSIILKSFLDDNYTLAVGRGFLFLPSQNFPYFMLRE